MNGSFQNRIENRTIDAGARRGVFASGIKMVTAVLLALLMGCSPEQANDITITAAYFTQPNLAPGDPVTGIRLDQGSLLRELTVVRGDTVIVDLVVNVNVAAGTPSFLTQERFDGGFVAATEVTVLGDAMQKLSDGKFIYKKRYRINFQENYSLATTLLDVGVNAQAPNRNGSGMGGGGNVQDGDSANMSILLARAAAPGSTATPTRVSAGDAHSLTLFADGAVWGWGNNDSNQIDELTRVPANTPVRIDIPQAIARISAGYRHSMAVSTNGIVYAWGSNQSAQLGSRRTTVAPELITGVANVIDVVAGFDASYAITADLALYAWGNNVWGQLGLPVQDSIDTPTLVPIEDVTKIAVGLGHTLALTSNGEVLSWGEGRYGQLGDQESSAESRVGTPTVIPGLSNVVDIAASRDTSYVVLGNGQALVFGRNENTGLGDVEPVQFVFPTLFSGVDDAVGVVAGSSGDSVLIVRRDASTGNTYYSAAGRNDRRQLAIAGPDIIDRPSAPNLPAQPVQIAMGNEHGLFIQQQGNCGAVWSWGSADDGRLGRVNTGTSRPVPYPVPGLGDAACAILTVTTDSSGIVNGSPGSIDCGATCSNVYIPGTSVTLDAPVQEASFLGFDGDCRTSNGTRNSTIPLAVDMSGHKYCPVSFRPPSGNIPPVASFTVSPQSPVDVGAPVVFDGSGSSDPDGSVTAWEWDFDGDGLADSAGETVINTYSSAGSFTAALTVTDDGGATNTVSNAIQVTNGVSAPPVAAFTVTPPGSTLPGTELRFDATTSTDDVGIVSWEWDFGNNGTVDATGVVATFTPPEPGLTEIRLRVADGDGQTNDVVQSVNVVGSSVNFFALRVTLTGPGRVNVTPPGIGLPNADCDGNECYLFDIAAGTVLTLDATAFTPAAFAGWSSTECDTVEPAINRCTLTLNSDRDVTATFQ